MAKKVDLDQLREPDVEISLNGVAYYMPDPTVRQRLENDRLNKALLDSSKKLDALRSDPDAGPQEVSATKEAHERLESSYIADVIGLYIPGITGDVYQELTPKQRDELWVLIHPDSQNEPSKNVESREEAEASPGEK